MAPVKTTGSSPGRKRRCPRRVGREVVGVDAVAHGLAGAGAFRRQAAEQRGLLLGDEEGPCRARGDLRARRRAAARLRAGTATTSASGGVRRTRSTWPSPRRRSPPAAAGPGPRHTGPSTTRTRPRRRCARGARSRAPSAAARRRGSSAASAPRPSSRPARLPSRARAGCSARHVQAGTQRAQRVDMRFVVGVVDEGAENTRCRAVRCLSRWYERTLSPLLGGYGMRCTRYSRLAIASVSPGCARRTARASWPRPAAGAARSRSSACTWRWPGCSAAPRRACTAGIRSAAASARSPSSS